MYTINTREVEEQTLLTEQRNVAIDGLTSWIAEAGGRQHSALAAHGGPIGPAVIIYHGEVNEDSDGPVEVCIRHRTAYLHRTRPPRGVCAHHQGAGAVSRHPLGL